MEVFLLLFLEFFKTGLFAVGGGLATLPFLYEMADKYTWFDVATLSDMIAVSESTPGPIGVNMATYAGYNAGFEVLGFGGGIFGALTATIALVLPSLIIILLISKFLGKFKDNQLVGDAFTALRPAVTALIAVAGFSIIKMTLLDIPAFSVSRSFIDLFQIPAIILFIVVLFCSNFWKKIHPIVLILGSAVIGIIFKF